VKTLPYTLPLCLSIVIHLGVVFAHIPGRAAQVPLEVGLTAVRLQLVPAQANQPAAPAVVARQTAPEQIKPPPAVQRIDPPPPAPQPAAAPTRPAPRATTELIKPVIDAVPTKAPAKLRAAVKPKPQTTTKQAPRSKARDGDLQRIGVRPARAIGLNTLVYPKLSRRLGHEGTVHVNVRVLRTGGAGAVRLIKSSGHARLDRAVIDHLRRSRYRSARRGGRAVTSSLPVAYRFELTSPNR
jgi:protein TonB